MENEFCTIEPCASAKSYEIKFQKKLDIEKARQVLANTVLSFTPVVLLCKLDGKPVSIYASGKAMIKEVSQAEANVIAEKLVKILKEAFE